jgi:putative ABC transport system ATP-binding protein
VTADASSREVLRAEDLRKTYETDAGPQPVLRGVNLAIAEGEFVAVMGPSGSGKSTLMNILGCLDVPTRGRCLLAGQDTAALDTDDLARLRNRFIGFVFQGFNLLPRATLLDNVALPLLYAGVPKRARDERARELLERVGLARFADYVPSRISGGQQQRVAIARSLANRPRLLLADEPTGNLDTATGREIMELFRALNAREGLSIVLVTHEHDIARYAARLINVIDGRIAFDGPTEEYFSQVAA